METYQEHYQRDGFVVMPPLLPPSSLDVLNAALSEWSVASAAPQNEYGILHFNLWQSLPPFANILHQSSLGALADESERAAAWMRPGEVP